MIKVKGLKIYCNYIIHIEEKVYFILGINLISLDLSKIKLMYPITHSIGFLQTLQYLRSLSAAKNKNEDNRFAKVFLRDFKVRLFKNIELFKILRLYS